uniref:Uncharacterized protein n=1 Tax=Glossina pallidipes TaxID=7398 RepID=A0A1B0AB61_GLOPL
MISILFEGFAFETFPCKCYSENIKEICFLSQYDEKQHILVVEPLPIAKQNGNNCNANYLLITPITVAWHMPKPRRKINPLNALSFSFDSYATVIERTDGLIGSKEETSKSRRFSIAAAAAAAAAAADAGELNSFSLCGFVDSVAAAEELCV